MNWAGEYLNGVLKNPVETSVRIVDISISFEMQLSVFIVINSFEDVYL